MSFHRREWLALIGAGAMIAGVFGPLVSIPFGGRPNLFELYELQGQPGYLWAGIILLVAAGLAVGTTVARRHGGYWVLGLGVLALWVVSYVRFQSELERASADMQARAGDHPFGNVAASLVKNIELDWGAFAILSGALALIGAAAWRRPTHSEEL